MTKQGLPSNLDWNKNFGFFGFFPKWFDGDEIGKWLSLKIKNFEFIKLTWRSLKIFDISLNEQGQNSSKNDK